MEDCECEKNKTKSEWLGDEEYGDDFLKTESFNIIEKIIKGINFSGFNRNAVFNKKLEQVEMENIDLEDVNVDYSYLKDKDLMTEDMLLEENVEEDEIPVSVVDRMLKGEESNQDTEDDISVIAEEILNDGDDRIFVSETGLDYILKDEIEEDEVDTEIEEDEVDTEIEEDEVERIKVIFILITF